jgi:hypothetical protein
VLVDKREYFRGYIFWGYVRKILKNIFYVLSFSSLIAASIYMLLFALIFLMLFVYFYMFDEDPRWGDSYWREQCENIELSWNKETNSCEMSKLTDIFVNIHEQSGASGLSEHVSFNLLHEVAKETRELEKIDGCITLLKSEVEKLGFAIDSVYNKETLQTCVMHLYPTRRNLIMIIKRAKLIEDKPLGK